MKKRIFSFALAVMMIFGVCFSTAIAAEPANTLKFDNNGKFKIMHICDCQDVYPANQKMLAFIDATLKEYQPDIVVLGGDNTVAPKESKDDAIKELVSVFVANETYFTLVFGNHDHEQGHTNDELLAMYQKHGGEYCLAYDAVPELHGSATHNLPVMDSTGTKTAFNLWMFDSGDYVYDENGERLGYDCVTEDQIDWYKVTSNALAEENGKKIPSLAFQHIIVGDVYDALFFESAIDMGEISRSFNGKTYSFLPKTENFNDFLFEFPCPGYYNHGQFDAMVEQGDVIGIFSGHDHTNSFVTELDGIKIVNTPGATFHLYGSELTRGMRLITIREDNVWDFDTEIITMNSFANANSDFAAASGINGTVGLIMTVLGDLLLSFGKLSAIFSNVISTVVG